MTKRPFSKVVWAALGVLALGLCVLTGGSLKQAMASTSTTTTQTINLTVNQVITLSISSSSLTLSSLTPGVPVFATSSATVTTNAPSGFNLQVNRVSPTSTIASGTITFPDATAWNGSNGATAPGQNLSFRANSAGTDGALYNSTWWGATDASGTAKFAGFPTSAQTYASNSSYSSSTQTAVMQIRADAPATQQATNYSGSILITALALP